MAQQLRGIGYGRVSGEAQRDNASLETQRAGVEAYARANHIQLVGWYQDIDSGANRDRDGLALAVAEIRAWRADVLVVYVVDRLGRDFAHSVWLDDQLRREGIPVHYVSLGGDTSDEGRQIRFSLDALVAQIERQNIARRLREGKQANIRKGRFPAEGQARYGYRYVGQGAERQLEVDPAESAIVRRIYAAYVAGQSVRRIVLELRDDAVPTRADTAGGRKQRGRGVWAMSVVYAVLRDEMYTGAAQVAHQGVVGVASVPPIIARDTWHAAQHRLDAGKALSPRNTKRFYLLGRRVRCAQCGYSVQGEAYRKGDREWRYYRCSGTRARLDLARACALPQVRADDLESAVWAYVLDALLTEENLHARAEAQAQRQARLRADALAERNGLIAQRKRLEGEIAQLIALARSAPNIPEIAAELGALNQQRESLTRRIEQPQDAPNDHPPPLTLSVARELRQRAADAGPETQRAIIDALDIRVRIDRQDGRPVAHVRSVLHLDDEPEWCVYVGEQA